MSETEVGAFDATGYRQRVLATLRGAARLDLSDPFFIVDLPVDVDDDELIRARIAALVGFWNKERSPNYKALTAELARHRADLEAVLLSPARRAACAAQVRERRAAADADRFGALDSLAEKLTARYQGLPRSRVPGLARLAKSKGVDDAAFARWLAGQHVIEDGASAEPLPVSIRAQIRGDLDELSRMTGDSSRSATLWAFLALPPAATDTEVAARHAELTSQNERRQHDHQMTVTANLLAYVRQYLMTADQARYTASLIEDAKDRLRDTIAEKVIVDGELSAADYEACVRRAVGFGFGLTSEQARTAVRQVATDLGATLAVAPAIEYLVCPNCREPQPATDQAACRYCGADLYLTCPSCARRVEAAAVACPHCGASFQLIRAAQDQIAVARAELGRGLPRAALTQLTGADRAARTAPALAAMVDQLSQEIERVITTAQADWQQAERDLAEHRLYGAMDRLARVARFAADVAGPAGVTASDRLDVLAARKAAVQAQIGTARGLPDQQKEAALSQILAVAADCAEALDMLAALPLAPPGHLRTEVHPDSVVVGWDATTAPGAVSYKVTRLISAPDGTRPGSAVLGTTTATIFEDAGVPGGALVAYEVTAIQGRRAAPAVRTEPVLMVREVTRLTARADGRDIRLTWALPISYGSVVVERSADPRSGLSLPPRRDLAHGQSWSDISPTPGVEFTYNVHAEYRDASGTLVRTPGATVRAQVTR